MERRFEGYAKSALEAYPYEPYSGDSSAGGVPDTSALGQRDVFDYDMSANIAR